MSHNSLERFVRNMNANLPPCPACKTQERVAGRIYCAECEKHLERERYAKNRATHKANTTPTQR